MLEKAIRNALHAQHPFVCLRCRCLKHSTSSARALAAYNGSRPYSSAATSSGPASSVEPPIDIPNDIPPAESDDVPSRTLDLSTAGPTNSVNDLKYRAVASGRRGRRSKRAALLDHLKLLKMQNEENGVHFDHEQYSGTPLSTAAFKGANKALQKIMTAPGTDDETAANGTNSVSEAKVQRGRKRRRTPGTVKIKKVPSKTSATEAQTISVKGQALSVIDVEQPSVPHLAYGLDRVLFNPGVYHMRDKRSGVYNFDPFLEKITPLQKFDFTTLNRFTPSSEDTILSTIASDAGKRYVGSTSSMTGVLKHFHFQLSHWREINTSMLSRNFPAKVNSFTKLTRAPDAIFLRYKNGTYAVDSDKMYDGANVLSLMGRYMEKLLTLDKETFQRYEKDSRDPIKDDERSQIESYHYSTMGDFVLRSQLDAHDTRLPGSGMFDLKTRAVVPIRMDSKNYEWGMGYEIRTDQGEYFSFEREYYDMLRSTLLKYSLQARIGRMDGIFVAYHNITRMFGFQYISIEEMDQALHGQSERHLGDQEFLASLKLLNEVLDRAIKKFPDTTLRLHFETREAVSPFMYIFAEPVTEEQADAIQTKNKAKIEEWEDSILAAEPATVQPAVKEPSLPGDGVKAKDEIAGSQTAGILADDNGGHEPDRHEVSPTLVSETSSSNLESPAGVVDFEESTVFIPFGWTGDCTDVRFEKSDEAPLPVVRHSQKVFAVLGDLDTVGITSKEGDFVVSANMLRAVEGIADRPHVIRTIFSMRDRQPAKANASTDAGNRDSLKSSRERETMSESSEPSTPILALILTTRNKLNGMQVSRPTGLGAEDNWIVEYSISEIDDGERARKLYDACVKRRRVVFENKEDETNQKEDFFMRKLRRMTEVSRKLRVDADQKEAKMREKGVEAKVRMFDDEEYPGKGKSKGVSSARGLNFYL